MLLLEDDLQFNHFILHNLRAWEPLINAQITVAGLYNQDFAVLACDTRHHCLVVDPSTIFGSQAFLISAPTVKYFLAHWEEVIAPLDFRIARLAARLDKPIFYHCPSLVKHVGRESVWGGEFCQAIDYDLTWKATGKKA